MPRLECGLLGPVAVWVADQPLELGPAPQQSVLAVLLAVLLAAPNTPVPARDLVDRIWGRRAPATGTDLVYGYVSRLRRVLAAAPEIRLVRQHGGYRLQTDPEHVDLHRFRRLVAAATAARDAGDDDDARALLGRALATWRGPAFGDLAGPWLEQLRVVLDRERLAATLDFNDLELRCGRHAAALPRLEELAVAEPLDERLAAQLMLARDRCGRRADALGFYVAFRRRLAEELGADPGPELQAVHQAILRATPSAPRVPSVTASGPAPTRAMPAAPAVLTAVAAGNGATVRPVPAQLPAAAAAFTGRRAELAALDAMLYAAGGGGGEPLAVVISAVSGAAGVGKSTLAVHWAHRIAHRYPDGQLFINLRGYGPEAPVGAADALAGFLRALGASGPEIPVSLDERAAMYRTLLNGRRVLLLLDNACSAEQVRPLLPGSAGCLVIVTSRDALGPLVAAEGAHPLTVDLLTLDEARQLLAARLGAHRVSAEPDAVEQIIARCARLPLALAIVAARAAARPGFPLAALAAELSTTAGTLDAFDAGDATTDIRTAFSWSYQATSAGGARLFRLLGLHPGPDFSTAAAASLAGVPVPQAAHELAELTRSHLLTEHVPGRYTLHDLLRAYATGLAGTMNTAAERRAAVGRLLDHYVRTGTAADRCLQPARSPIPLALAPPAPGAATAAPTSQEQATEWRNAESHNLAEALRLARDRGFHTHAWQLAWLLESILTRQGRWLDLVAAWQAAQHAAELLGDRAALAYAHRNLAYTHGRLGRYVDAHTHYDRALELYTATGAPAELARVHQNLAILWGQQERFDKAIDHARQALAAYRRIGEDDGQAYSLNSVGWYHAQQGDLTHALDHCEQALELFQRVGNRTGEAATWDSLGYAHTHLAQHAQAARCYRRAIDLYHALGDRYNEADTLTNLGDSRHAARDHTAARAAWRAALAILTDLDHADADAIRTRLSPPSARALAACGAISGSDVRA